MAYARHTWTHGDQPTAALMNNIEDGIVGGTTTADEHAGGVAAQSAQVEELTEDRTEATSAMYALSGAAGDVRPQVEASQNIVFARGGATGSGTTFNGYGVYYQPYVNLFTANTTGGLTCLVAGTYLVQCDLFMKNTDATLNLRKNGSTVEGVARIQTNKSTAIGQRMMGMSLVTLAVGDVLSFAVSRSSATTDTGSDLNITLYKIA